MVTSIYDRIYMYRNIIALYVQVHRVILFVSAVVLIHFESDLFVLIIL